MNVAVRMEDIIKSFPGGITANDRISITFMEGEIHALLGENGAGKTTLMNILYGLYRPDAGHIYIRGKEESITSSRSAIELGIGMVHQHFMLVDSFTVVENILLGLATSKYPILDLNTARNRVQALAEQYDLKVDVNAYIRDLSVGEQQRVEIIKALYRGARILILDEPTSVLNPIETEQLFRNLKQMKADKYTIIFISHKLNEVMDLTDRITVLRDGRVVDTIETNETDKASLARMMVGRDVSFELEKDICEPGPVIIAAEKIRIRNNRTLLAVKDVTFEIRSGEILGIAGVDGNGQVELAETLFGLRPLEAGEIIIKGKSLKDLAIEELIQLGVAYISGDKLGEGLIADFSLYENLGLREHKNPPISNKGFFNQNALRNYAIRLQQDYRIQAPNIGTAVKLLSGGNQQKVVLARELAENPSLIIAVQATHGLDIAATEFVKRQLLTQRAQGAAIMYISADLEEVISLSDRIAVMYEGEFKDILNGPNFNREKIGVLMGGGSEASMVKVGEKVIQQLQ